FFFQAEDGIRDWSVTGVQTCALPIFVTRVEARGEQLHVVLNDGSEADVEATTVRLGRGDVPYCRVKGDFDARFSRAATFQLLTLAEYDETTGRGTLRLGERRVPLRRSAWAAAGPSSRSCWAGRRR